MPGRPARGPDAQFETSTSVSIVGVPGVSSACASGTSAQSTAAGAGVLTASTFAA